MSNEPDYVLPESFISSARALDKMPSGELQVKLPHDTEALVRKVAEQSGLSAHAVASALLEEGISVFRSRGILF